MQVSILIEVDQMTITRTHPALIPHTQRIQSISLGITPAALLLLHRIHTGGDAAPRCRKLPDGPISLQAVAPCGRFSYFGILLGPALLINPGTQILELRHKHPCRFSPGSPAHHTLQRRLKQRNDLLPLFRESSLQIVKLNLGGILASGIGLSEFFKLHRHCAAGTIITFKNFFYNVFFLYLRVIIIYIYILIIIIIIIMVNTC